jgi:hypothetical protein
VWQRLTQETHGFKYWALSPLNTNLTFLDILTCLDSGDGVLGVKAYIDALGYNRSASLKPSHSHGLLLWGKEYGPKTWFAELKNMVRSLIHRLWSLTVYNTMLDIKKANVVNAPRMLQHFSFSVCHSKRSWPCFFYYQVRTNPFWFQLARSLCAWRAGFHRLGVQSSTSLWLGSACTWAHGSHT